MLLSNNLKEFGKSMHAVSFGKLRVPGYCRSIIIYCPLQTPALKENSILQKVHSPAITRPINFHWKPQFVDYWTTTSSFLFEVDLSIFGQRGIRA